MYVSSISVPTLGFARVRWRLALPRWQQPVPSTLSFSLTLLLACSISVLIDLLSSLSYCCSLPHRSLQKGTKLSSTSGNPRGEEAVDVATLLQRTQSALEQLQSEVWCSCGWRCLHKIEPLIATGCRFLYDYHVNRNFFVTQCSMVKYYNAQTHRFGLGILIIMSAICLLCSSLSALCSPQCDFPNIEAQSPGVFSSSSLRVAACDLQRLMATFSHVFETDMRDYCGREPPSFSTDTDIFQRVHHLLLAFITVLTHVGNGGGGVYHSSTKICPNTTLTHALLYIFLRSWTC